MNPDVFTQYRDKILANCTQVISGKDEVIFLLLVAFTCGGHVLIEDVPGTGKTMLLRAFAKTVGGTFKRVQFTPDLLPSDLTGITFYDQKQNDFTFRHGPLFANMVLADEINRATPRTQSALLEAMGERQITVDGTTYTLDEPFMVMATQNPLESYGTLPLPEAQTDRFFMRLSMGYMERAQEREIIARENAADIIGKLQQIVTAQETQQVRTAYRNIHVSGEVHDYIMDIIEATRTESHFIAGASTRGGIALYRAVQACAAYNGRDYAIPEDVQHIAPYALAHRLGIGNGIKQADALSALDAIINKITVPLERV
ncbi:MAG: AAA family ATPase [Defluviitaleaceae bacterium]|nr:AAA family ATPase [Defluviitaleaceae bacterium]MCL2274981.1 AAA family ATPase [Defluviitaleaceae bacterium]